jgi:hypothetical protein
MRFFRKHEPADPFAAFSERYGVRLPNAEPEEVPPEPEDEPPEGEAEYAGPLWAHSTLGVGLGASQKEISTAYRRLARVHHPDRAGDEVRKPCEESRIDVTLSLTWVRNAAIWPRHRANSTSPGKFTRELYTLR